MVTVKSLAEMVNYIKGKYGHEAGETAPVNGMVRVNLETGEHTPVRETDGGKLWAIIETNFCPDCNSEGFIAGPSGGMSQNIFCANDACKSGFNVTPVVGIAERI